MISMNCIPPRAMAASSAAALPAAKALILKRPMWNIGCATLVSMTQKLASSVTPPARPPSTHGLVHPIERPPYGWMPYVMAIRRIPPPAAKVRLPGQSIRPYCRLLVSRRLRYAQIVPNTPMGTFTQNTARQSHAASRPPATRPTNIPAIPAIWLMPRAMPRWLAGNASVRIAAELAISIDPPTACTSRHRMSHIAPGPPRKGSSESATDASVKMAKPRL